MYGGVEEVGGCAYLCGANSLLWYKKTMYTEQLRKEVERVVGRSMQSPLVCWYERNAEGEKEEWGFNYRWGGRERQRRASGLSGDVPCRKQQLARQGFL